MLLRKHPYTLEFDNRNPSFLHIDGYERPIELPVMPPEHEIRNYDLAPKLQKFTTDPFPTDFRHWDKLKQEEYAKEMWHIREHGEWVFIKGHPYYIPGKFWHFQNYWPTEGGGLPEFRMGGLELAQVWCLDVVRDENCYGLLDLKPRRVGDTEWGCAEEYEEITFWRNTRGGNLSYDEDEARDNLFQRIVNGHINMPPPFKPIIKGKDKPEKEMVFDYPAKGDRETLLDTMRPQPTIPSLRSKIDYKASTKKAYDGRRNRRILYDEVFKIDKFDPYRHWLMLRQTMSLHGGQTIIGKIFLPSTVEEIENEEMLQHCIDFWNRCDPKHVDRRGRTTSGIRRIFRDATLTAPVDEWGFHKKEEFLEAWHEEVNRLESLEMWEDAAKHKRQFPLTVEHALSIPPNQSSIYPHLIGMRIDQLLMQKNWKGKDEPPRGLRGTLIWEDEYGGRVKWVPDPKGTPVSSQGKWIFYIHPDNPCPTDIMDRFVPDNDHLFDIGIDPIDDIPKDKKKGASLSKAAILGLSADEDEDHILWTDDVPPKMINPEEKKTGRVAFEYLHRGNSTFEVYEDVLKTLIYTGAKAAIEDNKPYIRMRLEEEGFGRFIAPKRDLKPTKSNKKSKDLALKSSTEVISIYVGLAKEWYEKYWMIVDSLELLYNTRKFTGDNQRYCDLFVALGYALMKAKSRRMKNRQTQEEGVTEIWNSY